MHDVIVIYVGAFVELTRGQPLEDIWIASGIDKTSGSIALMQYVPPLRIQIFSISLIITGCDVTSAFIEKRKRS